MDRKICTKCSNCWERTVALAIVPYAIAVEYEGRKYHVEIPDLSVARCTKCGQIYFDHESSSQVTRAFLKQAGLLSPEEIRRQREQLGLAREELAPTLGVETAELVRWENGEQYQTRTADKFLRAFFTVPELREALAKKQTLELSAAG